MSNQGLTHYSDTVQRACPLCQCRVIARYRRSILDRLFSQEKHYVCRACYTRFLADGSVLVARGDRINPVLDIGAVNK